MKIFENRQDYQLGLKICETLQSKGFTAYIAGGAVRDFLLNRKPGDFDVATSATPDQVEALFSKTIAVGKSFGVIIVVDSLDGESFEIEVASFRKDGLYVDGRRPETVEFSSPAEDAERRDFTMNAIFYDPIAEKLHDFVGGEKDIQNKTIRAVGDAKARFQEDHLRILRALRQATELGFQIEENTWAAICELKSLAKQVSGERYYTEMNKLLKSTQVTEGIKLLAKSGIDQFQNLEVWRRCFGPVEDRWFRFFFSKGIRSSSHPEITELKCPKELKQALQKGLFWFEKDISQMPLGEIVDKSFDPDYYRGLTELNLEQKDNAKLKLAAECLRAFKYKKPEAFLKAQDLPKLNGAKLGQVLKDSYHAQLEGLVKTKDEALTWCQQRFSC